MSFVYLGYLEIEELNIAEPENKEYQLFLAIEDIDHSRTKAKSPQKLMEYVKGSIELSKMNFMQLPLEKRFIKVLMNCKRI